MCSCLVAEAKRERPTVPTEIRFGPVALRFYPNGARHWFRATDNRDIGNALRKAEVLKLIAQALKEASDEFGSQSQRFGRPHQIRGLFSARFMHRTRNRDRDRDRDRNKTVKKLLLAFALVVGSA